MANPTGMAGLFYARTKAGKTVPARHTLVLVWIAPFLFAAAGLLWLATSFYWVLGAEETTGTVRNINTWEGEIAGDPGQTLYAPVFGYIWSDGSETEASIARLSPDYNFEIGSTHRILFDPKVKGAVRFPGFRFNYLGPVIILAIGAMFSLVSLVLWIWLKAMARARDKKEEALP